MKRALDIVVAGLTLAVTSPLLLLLSAAIKLDSDGPAVFEQVRVGRGRRPFRLYKLRTMTNSSVQGPQITADADPRVTRVGSLLRKVKLDELPQLVNVLLGDMSVVGPRPEVPRYVERYRPEWLSLLEVRPGLTDLASVTFRDEERLLAMATDRERAYVEIIMPLKLDLALTDFKDDTLLHDLHIIIRTVLAVLQRRRLEDNAVTREAIRRIKVLNEEVEN
jgi:lipopolysaccharide/colanic/teichoic acid biosynthesis glycosyltransferase